MKVSLDVNKVTTEVSEIYSDLARADQQRQIEAIRGKIILLRDLDLIKPDVLSSMNKAAMKRSNELARDLREKTKKETEDALAATEADQPTVPEIPATPHPVEANCAQCGKGIYKAGAYWAHSDGNTYRHTCHPAETPQGTR